MKEIFRMDKEFIHKNWDRIEEKYKIIKGKIPNDNELNFDACNSCKRKTLKISKRLFNPNQRMWLTNNKQILTNIWETKHRYIIKW